MRGLVITAGGCEKKTRLHRSFAAFTLVELLVVMAIGLALMVFAAPQFISTSARARQSARDTLRGEFARARAHAIANAKDTAVIFAGYNNDSDLAGRALGIVEVAPDPDKPGFHVADTTSGEGLIERWQLLPTTVRFLPASSIGSKQPTLMEQVNLLSVTFGRRTVTGAYVIFSPTGSISYPPSGSPLSIALGLATITNNTVYLKESKNSGQAFDLLSVQRLTGRLRSIDPP